MPSSSLASPRLEQPRHNIFFALYPPSEISAAICGFTDRMFDAGTLRGPRVARDCLHISLNHLGAFQDLPNWLIDESCETVSKLKVRPFEVVLNRFISFENRNRLRPRVLTGDDGLIGVDGLYQELNAVLGAAGLPHGSQRIARPHLTLSREENALPEDFIEPVSWWVRDFRLIHSPRGESRHNVLGCWPLEG